MSNLIDNIRQHARNLEAEIAALKERMQEVGSIARQEHMRRMELEAILTASSAIPEGITRDDTVHGETYYTAADTATAAAQGFRDGQAAQAAAGHEPVAPPMDGEIALIEKALERAGISSLLNHGAASCVFTEGCCGVSQDHILAYTREIALHCAVALGAAPQPAVAAGWMSERENLRKALQFYAAKEHFAIADDCAWDTVSGEPKNYWCDEAGTATVEDGSIARLALAGKPIHFEDEDTAPLPAPSTEGESNG